MCALISFEVLSAQRSENPKFQDEIKMKLSVKLGNFSKQHGRAMILNLRFAASRDQRQGSSLTIA